MFSFFKRKNTITPDLSFIGADMHSHLLPELDDGVKTLEESIEYIRELSDLGYKKLICTPHIIADMYPNNVETILPQLAIVQKAVFDAKIPVTIEAAAEYMVGLEMEQDLKDGKQLLSFGDRHILIEMSYIAPSPNIEQVIFQLCLKGYKPILAHPERYNYYQGNLENYQRFIDLGCLLQINLLSLTGYYGKLSKHVAEKLLKENMVSLVGTDMHHATHLRALKDLASQKELYEKLQAAGIRNKELFLDQ